MRLIIDDLERVAASPIAASCASAWQPDPESLQIFRVSSNFVFRFKTAGVRRFLRFAHESERTRAEIEAELCFVRHCAADGSAVALPVFSSNDRQVEDVETDAGLFHVVAFERAIGRPLVTRELGEPTVRAWGGALARIHLASETLPDEVVLARKSWETEVERSRQILAREPALIRDDFEAIVRRLDSLPRDPSAFGLVHGDFASDNVFADGDRICSIDFDDAVRSWYAADIAFTFDWSGTDQPLERTHQLLAWFLAGYRLERSMEETWIDRIPDFVRFETYFKLARLTRAYQGADPKDDLTWLAAMRARHVEMIEGLRARCRSPRRVDRAAV